jgi:myo-inositol 2-dehydrogenase/D-chiro-inositol 1-dehydrogenase
MNVLILGNGIEELGWARWLLASGEHRLDAAYPGFAEPDLAAVPAPRDLDDALARSGIDAVVVGGPIEIRGEYLRRAAAEGLAIICLHPPGDDSEAYYQVSLSRAETGAVIVPDLPLRLHPGAVALFHAQGNGEIGDLRGLRIESPSGGEGIDLARAVVPRLVDVVRAFIGEIEALTATGDPPGDHPDLELVVQLRAAAARRAELRIRSGADLPARLALQGTNATLTLEFDPRFEEPARLVRHEPPAADTISPLAPWSAHAAIFSVLIAARTRRAGLDPPSPNLHDGTRATELSEATVRSLRRGRTVDLYYEPISEEATFKSVMTSTGCVIFLLALVLLPLALAGPPLGWNWTIFVAYLIPPMLVLFVILQSLRFAVRDPSTREDRRDPDADGS